MTVYVEPFIDARDRTKSPFKDPKTIGKIEANVYDIYADRLTLSEDVSDIVTNAFIKEFSSAGYTVKGPKDGKKDADFILSGEIREFRLDILERDKIDIEISSNIIDKETGKALWSGTETAKEDKYAGVMGNSRATIANYIFLSLSKVTDRIISEANSRIMNTKAAYSPTPLQPLQASPEGAGRIVFTTEPSRSKIYVNDVYYGLTPLTIDIEPGVYEISVKQKGFKTGKEKVSVRPGQLTEFELTLEKE